MANCHDLQYHKEIDALQERLGIRYWPAQFPLKTYHLVFVASHDGVNTALGVVVDPPSYYALPQGHVYIMYPAHKGCQHKGHPHGSVSSRFLRPYKADMTSLSNTELHDFKTDPRWNFYMERAADYYSMDLLSRMYCVHTTTRSYYGEPKIGNSSSASTQFTSSSPS